MATLMSMLGMWIAGLGMVACARPAPIAPSQDEPALPAPQTAPAVPDPGEAVADAQQLDPAVDELLARLEQAADELRTFTARIDYEKYEAFLDRRESRSGELIYRLGEDAPVVDGDADAPGNANAGADAAQSKSFAILFETEVINLRKREVNKHYIFDGRWLAEIDHAQKQFIKQEVVPPGEALDPLKLGEGPFPLPIGQSKADVLARFDVTPAALPAQGLLKDLQGVDGLKLVPKPNTAEAKEFEQVEIFYDREALLPVGVIAREVSGDVKTVRLTNLQRNPQLDAAQRKKLDIRDPDPREWRVDIRPWRP